MLGENLKQQGGEVGELQIGNLDSQPTNLSGDLVYCCSQDVESKLKDKNYKQIIYYCYIKQHVLMDNFNVKDYFKEKFKDSNFIF